VMLPEIGALRPRAGPAITMRSGVERVTRLQ
jgi:hypothetical protein